MEEIAPGRSGEGQHLVMSFWKQLDEIDRSALIAVNDGRAAWADPIMEGMSTMVVWFPLYVFLLVVLQRRFGWKGLGLSVLLVAGMVLCSDMGSVMLFKETVQRLRPCHEPALQGLVEVLHGNCGGKYGFVSAHASNHFAIALFMIGALGGRPAWAKYALLLWAALIAYSRVYLGVHYPGDVLAGALYGAAIGAIFAMIHRRWVVRKATA